MTLLLPIVQSCFLVVIGRPPIHLAQPASKQDRRWPFGAISATTTSKQLVRYGTVRKRTAFDPHCIQLSQTMLFRTYSVPNGSGEAYSPACKRVPWKGVGKAGNSCHAEITLSPLRLPQAFRSFYKSFATSLFPTVSLLPLLYSNFLFDDTRKVLKTLSIIQIRTDGAIHQR